MLAYATAADYRARASVSDTIADGDVEAQLQAVSDYLDRSLGVAPGSFAPVDADDEEQTLAFISSGDAERTFWRSADGFAYFMRDVSQIELVDDRGSRHMLLPSSSSAPGRVILIGDPSRGLVRLGARPFIPQRLTGVISVTGRPGWAAVPAPIREVTIGMAHDLRDAMRAGAAGRVNLIDEGIEMRPDTQRLYGMIRRQYGQGKGGIR